MAAGQQMAADERMARDLHQQEMAQQQQLWGNPPPGAQMGVPGGAVPVVQGMVVSGGPPGMPLGSPVVIGSPATGSLPFAVAALEEMPQGEAVVLRYRLSLMCFAIIDAMSTVFDAATSFSTFGALGTLGAGGEAEGLDPEEAGDMSAFQSFGLLGLLFLVGPLAGLIGAKRLRRALVGAYLAFCLAKLSYLIFLAVVAPRLWYILIAVVQLWVTKIVFSFWRALGLISKERCVELLNPTAVMQRGNVRMVIW